jgi:hypothetical protein
LNKNLKQTKRNIKRPKDEEDFSYSAALYAPDRGGMGAADTVFSP